MMATVPHVTSGLGLRKFQADGFLLTRVYEQSLGIHSCVRGEIYPSLALESSSPRRTRKPDSYVYGHLKRSALSTTKNKRVHDVTTHFVALTTNNCKQAQTTSQHPSVIE